MSSRPAARIRRRVVFDCNTLIQAIAFDSGPAARCIQLIQSGQIEAIVSRETLRELRRVLQYADVREMSPNVTPARSDAFLKWLTFRATLLRRVPHAMDFSRDPDDEPYIDLAIAAKADYLVARDKDLLSLVTGHSAECKRFRQLSHPLRIIDPVILVRIFSSDDPVSS